MSEGAGLSRAGGRPIRATTRGVSGVVGLGLPDVNELGWRWRDSLIYVTHGVPERADVQHRRRSSAGVAPLPLAAIHSTHDEFVPHRRGAAGARAAAEPKRLWIVKPSDHRFSDNLPEFDRTAARGDRLDSTQQAAR